MRVRHLQTHLVEQQLVNDGKLDTLRGLRIGIDAVFWLRSIQQLKDPFADALGGVPPGIFGFVDRELEGFRKYGITPVFVFQGIAPGPQHSMFVNRMEQQMETAWGYLARGQKSEAQKCFAVSTSRINGDFVYFIFHHLRQRGCEVLMAPYFAGAQLAHFAEQQVVNAVFGPPGLLLYTVPRVIIQIDLIQNPSFEWVDLKSVLNKWDINKEQFIDACMLAGTEYCLTYPYLNPNPSLATASTKFQFDNAIDVAKKAPLINWMQTFPSDEMKNDHIDGYCICKVLVQSSPVLHTSNAEVRPLGSTSFHNLNPSNGRGQPSQVPLDFHEIIGAKLPGSLYYLMVQGVISHKIPQAFARKEWIDKTQPLVDTMEFRNLLQDLNDYREKAINRLAPYLHASFQKQPIVCKAFWEQQPQGRHGNFQAQAEKAEQKVLMPDVNRRGLRWRITSEALEAEKQRQNDTRVDLKFCLKWHEHEFFGDGELYRGLSASGEPSFAKDRDSLSALVHFMLLEHLELIADDGGMTAIGAALKDTPKHLMEPCLIALELMKFGCLNGEPFEPTAQDKPFPQALNYPPRLPSGEVMPRQKSIYLLTRIMSLVPMRLKVDMWNADVIFDLAAFHAMVRILKRSFRQLTEASLASVLMKDMSQAKLLPAGFLCASPSSKDHMAPHGLMPTFMLPRACMGIVADFFLNYSGSPDQLHREMQAKFPCCQAPREDLQQAMVFWEEMRRCVDQMNEQGLGIEDVAEEMNAANEVLREMQKKLNFYPDTKILRGDETEKVKAFVSGSR